MSFMIKTLAHKVLSIYKIGELLKLQNFINFN